MLPFIHVTKDGRRPIIKVKTKQKQFAIFRMNLTRIERTTLPHQLLFQSRRNNRIMGFTLEILRENDKKDRPGLERRPIAKILACRIGHQSTRQTGIISISPSVHLFTDRCASISISDAIRHLFFKKKKGAQRQNTTHLQQMRQTEYVVHTRHKKELTTPYSCKGV